MVGGRSDYTGAAVAAARSVLLELVRVLGEYREEIVVIGGWVPELLLAGGTVQHVGSIDVDLALDHRRLQDAGYRTIQRLLLGHGYRQGSQPFIFFRRVRVGEREIDVEVDLLAGEYEGTGKSRRTQRVQDVRPRKARGCDLAFEMSTEIHMEGTLPDGARDSAHVRVASVVPFFIMKGMALHDRLKPKDAWDLYFCLLHYPGGLDALITEFQPHLTHGLVREGLLKIAEKFASPDHVGPRFTADFDDLTVPDDRELRQRDAFERMEYLLSRLGMR